MFYGKSLPLGALASPFSQSHDEGQALPLSFRFESLLQHELSVGAQLETRAGRLEGTPKKQAPHPNCR